MDNNESPAANICTTDSFDRLPLSEQLAIDLRSKSRAAVGCADSSCEFIDFAKRNPARSLGVQFVEDNVDTAFDGVDLRNTNPDVENVRREEDMNLSWRNKLNLKRNPSKGIQYSRNRSFNKKYYRMQEDYQRIRYNTKQVYSAGILPFSVHENTVYLLLGKDNDGKWSDFGGRSEGQDRGRFEITACREFYEESVGAICDIPTILSRLQHAKHYIRLVGKTLNQSPYFMYFVKIPYMDSYRNQFHSTLSFIRFARNFDTKYIEKTDIQWISFDTIMASLDECNEDTINYPLRKVFKKTFTENIDPIYEFLSKT